MDSSSKNSTERRRLSFNNCGGDHQVSTNNNVSAALVAVERLSLVQQKNVLVDMLMDPRVLRITHYKSLLECLVTHSLVRESDLPGDLRLIGFTGMSEVPRGHHSKIGSDESNIGLPSELWLHILSFVNVNDKFQKLPIVSAEMGKMVKTSFAWTHPISVKVGQIGLWSWCPSWCNATSLSITLIENSPMRQQDIAHLFHHLLKVKRLRLEFEFKRTEEDYKNMFWHLPTTLEHLNIVFADEQYEKFTSYEPFWHITGWPRPPGSLLFEVNICVRSNQSKVPWLNVAEDKIVISARMYSA